MEKIKLENCHDGSNKEFRVSVAESILRKAAAKKTTKTWKLPEDSEFKFDDGRILPKPVKKAKPPKESPKEED